MRFIRGSNGLTAGQRQQMRAGLARWEDGKAGGRGSTSAPAERRAGAGRDRICQRVVGGLAVLIAVALLRWWPASGAMTANSTRDRTISFYGVNTKETLTIQYMKNGKHIPEAMQKINWILRDWRKDEPTEMDPDLIDLVWEIHNELGSAEPINVISAYRSRDTNEMLRRTVGGQASQSRHILGKAMDVHFPRRAGEEAALLGPHPRARRRRLLPDLGHAVRAHRHRPRARLAARCRAWSWRCCSPTAARSTCRTTAGRSRPRTCAGRALPTPSWPQQIAEFHELRAHPQGADPGCLAGAVAAATPVAAAAGGAAGRAVGTRPTDRERAGAGGAGGRAAAAARRRRRCR